MPERVQEKIGSVTIDRTWYGGEDQYSDGEVEEELLAIVKSADESELNRIIGERKDWGILYHLSDIRENIVNALPIKQTDHVLEIGAGCGAITGALARMAGSVTCVDLSYRRSLINANRHKTYDNITILVGNFRDIEPHLEETYDYITLIGVFEYAQGYIGTQQPYVEFLREISAHLSPGGKIVMAIENRLGLKYWAGCREDHTGHLFEGLENYPEHSGVRTFSRPELECLFAQAGLTAERFAYPYPDYKLPDVIYSDEYLPKEGELNRNVFNYDRERLLLFDETKVFDSLIASGQFPLFANSYLVTLAKADQAGAEELPAASEQILYSKFSGDRDERWAIRTDILREDDRMFVRKKALKKEAGAHLQRMAEHSLALAGQYPQLRVNRVLTSGEDEVTLEYLTCPQTLENEVSALLSQGVQEEAFALVRRLCALIREAATLPFTVTDEYITQFGEPLIEAEGAMSAGVTDLDMLLENILVHEDDSWELIDYEWTVDFPVPAEYVCFRVWHYFLARSLKDSDAETILLSEGYTSEQQERFREMERNWQRYIAGDRVTLGQLYQPITPGRRDVRQEMMLTATGGNTNEGTLYYRRNGEEDFAEERTRRVKLNRAQDGHFEAVIDLSGLSQVRELRWDPIDVGCCRIKISHLTSDGFVHLTPLFSDTGQGWDSFLNMDPAYAINGDFNGIQTIVITGELRMLYLQTMSDELSDLIAQKKENVILKEKVRRLEEEIEAIHATKGDRALVRAREMRNSAQNTMRRVGRHLPFRRQDSSVPQTPYHDWFLRHKASEEELEEQRQMVLTHTPLISILVPTYHTPENFLRDMIDSVLAQTYPHWQLCIADASVESRDGQLVRDDQVKTILDEYAVRDSRIVISYLDSNEGISVNTNRAALLAKGEYIALLDHDDLLAPDCLFEVAAQINQYGAQVVYTDEDKVSMDGTIHFDPNMKPDFSPDLLRSHNYITHFLTVSAELFHETGGLHPRYDGAQDYDLILRCTEKARVIRHVPKVLYHWRMHQDSTAQNPESKLYAYEAGKRALEDHLERCGDHGHVEILPDLWGMYHITYDVPKGAKLSIIIPNKDHIQDLEKCITSILEKSTFKNIEFVVVENNSTQRETMTGYMQIKKKYPQVRFVKWNGSFNYSAINNYGVRHATGDYLLLLNNDTSLIEPESLSEMLGICARKEVGCVGAKLLYADDTVQHAGVVLGFGAYGGFAGHVFHGKSKDDLGFMLRPRIVGNYSAVTAACLMVRREVYEQVNGLDESFVVALNDIDFCLRVRQMGYVNVFTPFSLWYHYESKSRGYEDTPEKEERFKGEVARFRERWADVVDAGDPYYNPNFPLTREPFTLD